tara:strand:- start:1121 stop:1441 length:321 start_codon:yes stop_codon:yes gene_type:complete
MTEDDADEILMLMSQMWFSNTMLPEGTIKIWHSALLQLEKPLALEAVEDLVRNNSYWPSIAEFRTHYSSLVKRKNMEIKPIEREYLPREENVKRLRALRESLKSRG